MRLLSIVVLLLAASAARADDKDVARQAYVEGTRYYDLNDFQHALDAFKRAYLHFDEPVLLYNIAQCHRQLGDENEALKFYRSYLRKAPNAPNKEEVKRLIAGLEATMAQEQKTRTSPPAAARSRRR